MNTLEQDLIRTLEAEYAELLIKANGCAKAIALLNNKRETLIREIQHLRELDDSTQQGKIEELKKEKVAVKEQLEHDNKELKEMNDKMQLMLMHCNFQKDFLELWNKEDSYKSFLAETGLSTREALLQEQGYALQEDDSVMDAVMPDYLRIGRQDIADLLTALKDPANHLKVFEKAKLEYTQNPDYNYGYVYSLCLDYGWGTAEDKRAASAIDKKFANLNHPLALLNVASEYEDEDSLEFDSKKAIELYQKAVGTEQQFYIVHAIWGKKLLKGEGVERDEIEGLHFLNIANAQGCVIATVTLMGYCQEKVNALDARIQAGETEDLAADIKDAEEQVYFYAKKLDAQGAAIGKYYLAMCYCNGYGVTIDKQQYFKLINECVAMHCSRAIGILAGEYQRGFEGILESDPIRSLTLYFACLRSNGSDIEVLMGFKTLIANNMHCTEFMTIAYDLCKKCLQGHFWDNGLDSTVIGLFYQHGILVPENIEKAILCFIKGADLGASEAATAMVKLSMHKENAGLIPISLAQKYFSEADDYEIGEVRLHYNTQYLPLFHKLKQTWPTVGLGATFNVPDGITRLIADYADNALDEEKKTSSKLGS
jgi:TPR repeat protein